MRHLLVGLVCGVLTACGDSAPIVEPAPMERSAIAPQQFALVPCLPVIGAELPPCQLLAAGGKYYLLGAPEGALASLREEEVRLLDGVLLFTLLPSHIDGLDTVRNTTWLKGRSAPLMVAGPEGTEALTSGLDSAYEISDAELFSRETPAGGYDASLMKPVEIVLGTDAGTGVVNTGDLIIRGFYAPSGQVVYQAQYNGQSVGIGMCGGDEDVGLIGELSVGDRVSTCNENSAVDYILE